MLAYLQTYLSGLVMGNSTSNQFLRALRNGDAAKAKELYLSKSNLKENIEPNQSLGADHDDNTYLHYAALCGMSEMYRDLMRHKGKPDIKNSHRRNCLHLLCLDSAVNGSDDLAKFDMLRFTLEEGLQGMDLKHVLSEKDKNGNTALHLAAGAGLKKCVDLLISYQADMVATNEDGLTPADLAKARNHQNIASNLEAQMVFPEEDHEPEDVDPEPNLLQSEETVGMQDKDLRSMKDALLIETSEMLGVSLQSAEVLLRNYGWSKEELLEAWIDNPANVLEKAGVDVLQDEGKDFLSNRSSCLEAKTITECGICYLSCDQTLQVPCGHVFCKDCWKLYLEERITGGKSQSICCPEYSCYRLVPLELIESVVSREIASKFLSFDIKDFVDSNPNIRWCPHPGCSQAVGRPSLTEDPVSQDGSQSDDERKGRTVHCGYNHYFCWDCLSDSHEPCTCSQWKRWLDHCEEMKEKVGETTAAEANEAASSKWLANNSKPCPKCKSPIQKNEGCNHMCCKHCRHDFCWVCMDDWKQHNSSTGGYFNCNRYDAQRKATFTLERRRSEVMKNCEDWDKISKFIHFYERYKEHINSLELEEPFLDKAQEKMVELAHSIQHLEERSLSGGKRSFSVSSRQLDFTFIEDAVNELLRCRRVLKATYGYGYYVTGIISTKQFEHMQGSLEQVTEMLAEAVARPHLRKPRSEIILLMREAREKRTSLVKNVHSGLPLSHYPFLNSTGSLVGRGLLLESNRRFLHDLDTYTPNHRLRDYGADTDDNLLRVLEISRREFEADKQMQADVELAMTISLDHSSPPDPQPLHTTPILHPEDFPQGESWLDQWCQQHPHDSLEFYGSPLTGEVYSSSPEEPVDIREEWGPLYGEEEDIREAIKDSLKESSRNRDHIISSDDIVSNSNDCLISSNARHDLLVAGLHSNEQRNPVKGSYVGPQREPRLHHRNHRQHGGIRTHGTSNETSRNNMLEFINWQTASLPPTLKQLLESNERQGTNV